MVALFLILLRNRQTDFHRTMLICIPTSGSKDPSFCTSFPIFDGILSDLDEVVSQHSFDLHVPDA